jgi:hypothetical protein
VKNHDRTALDWAEDRKKVAFLPLSIVSFTSATMASSSRWLSGELAIVGFLPDAYTNLDAQTVERG